jgi:hypothetical protein
MKKTPHTYRPLSIVAPLVLFLCGVIPGSPYVWYAVRRVDRTCSCTVNHQILERER